MKAQKQFPMNSVLIAAGLAASGIVLGGVIGFSIDNVTAGLGFGLALGAGLAGIWKAITDDRD